MTTVWQLVDPYFDRDEAWGDPDKINGLLVLLMWAIRQSIPDRYNIHFGTQGTHTPGSQHGLGNADDGHFISSLPFYDQIIRLESVLDALQVSDRVGLGIYPAWDIPGFHIDVRGYMARWGWIGAKKPDKTMEYCSYQQAKMFAQAMNGRTS